MEDTQIIPRMKEMTAKNSSNEKYLDSIYDRVNDQFILSRNSQQNTHQWVISLALALITAVLTLGGNQNPYPSEFNFIAILVSLPLLIRFFVRSCLETSILYKWMTIRNALDEYYFLKSKNKENTTEYKKYLDETIFLYYFKWKSPTRLGKIIWDNVRLAYFWPFIVIIALIVWGYVVLPYSRIVCITSIIVSSFMVYEIITFFTYKGFKYKETQTGKPQVYLSDS